MRKFLAAVAALGAAVGMSTVAQANVVYAINQSSTVPETGGELSPLSDTVLGTITTDGTIGVLKTANILSWDLHLNDNIRPLMSSHLTPANSGIWFDTGDGLSASATGLSFDFSGSAVFIIQENKIHGFSSGFEYFCFQAKFASSPCLGGETIVPNYFSVDGVRATDLIGTVPLSGGGGVPEPATWALMLLGFGGLGAAMRSRRGTAIVSA